MRTDPENPKPIKFWSLNMEGTLNTYTTIRAIINSLYSSWATKKKAEIDSQGPVGEHRNDTLTLDAWKKEEARLKKKLKSFVSDEVRGSSHTEQYKVFRRAGVVKSAHCVVRLIPIESMDDIIHNLSAGQDEFGYDVQSLIKADEPKSGNGVIKETLPEAPVVLGPDDPVFEDEDELNLEAAHRYRAIDTALTHVDGIVDKMGRLLDLNAVQRKQLAKQMLNELGIGQRFMQFEGHPWIGDFDPNIWMTVRELARELDAGTPNSGRPHTQYVRRLLKEEGIGYTTARESHPEVGEVHNVLMVRREDAAILKMKFYKYLPPIGTCNPHSIKNPSLSRLAQ